MTSITLTNELELEANELMDALNLGITIVVTDDELYNDQGAQLMGCLSDDFITVSMPALYESSQANGYDVEIAFVLNLAHEVGHYLCEHEPTGAYNVVELVIREIEAWQSGVQIIRIVQEHMKFDVNLSPLYDCINLENIKHYCYHYAESDCDAHLLYSRIRNKFVHQGFKDVMEEV